MKNDTPIRLLREASHNHKYRVVAGCDCVYCGTPVKAVNQGSAGDHVPPLAVLDANFGVAVGDMETVPCCSECNTLLGAIPLVTVAQRRAHVLAVRPLVGKTEAQIIAGAMYNANINEGFKRGEGQVDTPDVVAGQILDKLQLLGSFCDPACGDGSFVRMQIRRLVEAGVDNAWIEANVRGYDNDVEMAAEAVRRLRREFPSLDGKAIFKQQDIFTMKDHFTTIIMNPPWNLKTGGKTVERNTWRKFADAALKLAETVVVVAPMSARQAGKRVLVEAVRFEGVEHDGCAVVWSEDAAQDFSAFPKFDLHFLSQVVGGDAVMSEKGKRDIHSVELENWRGGAPYWATPRAAATYKVGEPKGLFRLNASGKHEFAWSKSLRPGNVAYGEQAEFERFCAYASSEAGVRDLRALADRANMGFINLNKATLNAAFSSRVTK
jgi:hypothetical protein